jgi:hypothetical protein
MDWLPKEKAVASDDVWSANRVMLAHFDDYSTALVFAKWGGSLLFPGPLPASAALPPAPAEVAATHDGEAVKAAIVARLGLNADELVVTEAFQHWALADEGLIRVHLLRFNTFEAPKAELEPHGAVFQPISALRGCDKLELALAREVFNLIIGAGGGRA